MITRKQFQKLNSINKSSGTVAKDYKDDSAMYDFLLSQGYIHKHYVRGYMGFIVSEAGKVQMKLYKDDTRRFLITTFISFIALITSITSILLQSETLQELLLTLLK